MGKGDRRSRRGKLFRGTFGRTRKHAAPTRATDVKATGTSKAAVETPAEAPKKKRTAKKKSE